MLPDNILNGGNNLIKRLSLFILIFSISGKINAREFKKPHQLKTIFYKLDYKINFQEKRIAAFCEMTLQSHNEKPVITIPLLLYRLMKVASVKEEKGNALQFHQRIVSFEDWDTYQANYIEVKLPKPLLKGNTYKLRIEYNGYLHGYTETGNEYVRDKIDPDFTILRPDCLAYPELGYPNDKLNKAAGFEPSFNYELKITVPDSLTAVNGGEFIRKDTKDGYSTFSYKNSKLAWRIDIMIGKYKTMLSPPLKIHYLEQDQAGAETVLRFGKKAFALYSKWWGELKEIQTFCVIEIPRGYGSQADVTCILQSADAFTDSTEMRQLYHELSHLWNVTSTDKYYARWNEGLATFVEYLTIEKLENRSYLDYVTDWFLGVVKKEIESDSLLKITPPVDFGKKGIQSYSYGVGMILFRVLYEVMGETDFNKCIGKYYSDYYVTGAGTNQFVEMAIKLSDNNLTEFFRDWMYTAKYTQFISNGLSIKEMSKKYIKY